VTACPRCLGVGQIYKRRHTGERVVVPCPECTDHNRQEAAKRRDEGMALARTVSRQELLRRARHFAVEHARRHGSVTADDISRQAAAQGIDLAAELGNAMGSIFRSDPRFEDTGRVATSERKRRRAGAQRIWRLAGERP